MKKFNQTAMGCLYAGICLGLLPADVLADEGSNWRPTYDLVMLWINFGILVFVGVKFGREPIMNFLRGREYEVANEIGQIEKEREAILAKVRETRKLVDESESQFADLKQKVIEQGEKRKQEIIEEAQQQSQAMLETAKQKIGNKLLQAKNKFRAEMVDEAIALALERLPKEITEEDNQRLVDQYMGEHIAAVK
jgi:F-type H+-transporting ATPase subunit b